MGSPIVNRNKTCCAGCLNNEGQEKKKKKRKRKKRKKEGQNISPPHTCIVLEIYLFSMEGEIEIYSVCGVDLWS